MSDKIKRHAQLKEIMRKSNGPMSISEVYSIFERCLGSDISRKTIHRDIMELIENGDIKQSQERPIKLVLIPKKNYTIEFEEAELVTLKTILDSMGACQGVDMGIREKVISKIQKAL